MRESTILGTSKRKPSDYNVIISSKRGPKQPQSYCEIDWSNPVTDKMVLAWLPNKRVLTSFGEIKGTLSGANANASPGVYGLGINYGQSGIQGDLSPLVESINTPQTFLLVGAPPPSGQSWSVAMTTGSGVFRKWGGSYSIHAYPSNVANIASSGQWTTEAVVIAQVGATVRFFVDGVNKTNLAGQGTSQPVGTPGVQLFQSVAGDRSAATYWAAKTYLMLKWDRYLTDSEISSLSTNPWQVFRTKDTMILPT